MAYRLDTDEEPKNCGPNNSVLGLYIKITDRPPPKQELGKRAGDHDEDEHSDIPPQFDKWMQTYKCTTTVKNAGKIKEAQ